MLQEHQGAYETQSAAVAAIAPKIVYIPDPLKVWVRQVEKDSGARDGTTSAERDKIKELEREVRQLRQANEILRKASAYFAQAPLAVCMQTAAGQWLHRGTPDGQNGVARYCQGKGNENNDPGRVSGVPTRQGEPQVPSTSAKYAVKNV